MLVLSRKPGESIAIGDNILIRVVEVRGQRVRVAIDAPAHVLIMRTELTGIAVASTAAAATPLPGRTRPPARRAETHDEDAELMPDFIVY